jgi:protein arginine kinase activator
MAEPTPPHPETCEQCGKAPAAVKIRRVAGGEEVEIHLCLACAKERGLEPGLQDSGVGVDLVTLMLKNLNEMEGGSGVCDVCGLTYSRFRETGRLGCAHCYRSFAKELRPLIRRIHGEVRHVGKVLDREGVGSDREARLRRLNEDLERAIGAEEYERAAAIRDLIQELEAAAGGSRKESR